LMMDQHHWRCPVLPTEALSVVSLATEIRQITMVLGRVERSHCYDQLKPVLRNDACLLLHERKCLLTPVQGNFLWDASNYLYLCISTYALLLHFRDMTKADITVHIWDLLGWDDPIMRRNTSRGIPWSLDHQGLSSQSKRECLNSDTQLSWVALDLNFSCQWRLNDR